MEISCPSPLPVFENPTYESSSSECNSLHGSSNTNSLPKTRSLCSTITSQQIKDLNHELELDPVEQLRNLTREISPGITISKLTRKESMSDPHHNNPNFPVIIKRSSSKESSKSNSLQKKLKRWSNDSNNSEEYWSKNLNQSYWDSYGDSSKKNSSTNVLSITTKRNSDYYDAHALDLLRTSLEENSTYCGYTKKQWVTLGVFSFVNIFSAIIINLQAPFYPGIALGKGASHSEIGFVFGSYEFIVFAMSPVFGKYMEKLGPKRVFNTGIIVTGTCSVLFGFLTFVDDHYTFISLSFLVRVIEALGSAGHVTATFTLIAIEFPDSVFTVFASMETCSGLGLILGPLLGSVLYEAGATFGPHFQFLLPFVTLGGILFIGALMAYFIMPAVPIEDADEVHRNKQHSFRNFIRIPSVALSAASIFGAAISLGYNAPTLEPHLVQSFELNTIAKGAMFIINGGTYALTAPIVGKICDKTSKPKVLILLGSVLILGGYTLIGPAPFYTFNTILWITCAGLFIQGLGLSCSFVSSFTQAMKSSLEAGFPNSIETYGLVSGLWMSMFALGNCVGPSIGGLLTEYFDYRTGTLFVMGLHFILILATLAFIIKGDGDEIPNNEIDDFRPNKHSDLAIQVGENGISGTKLKMISEFTNA